jgi:hypothetical protein
MHDKMDHVKTAFPVFSPKKKQLDGHRDVRYAYYGLNLFAHDSNYTVGSFARLF